MAKARRQVKAARAIDPAAEGVLVAAVPGQPVLCPRYRWPLLSPEG